MGDELVWFALVKVKPLKGNEILPKVKGAYVNVACISENEQTFKVTIEQIFKSHLFKVISIEDIENKQNLVVETDTSEYVRLLNEINEGYEFAWGTFHSF